QAADGIRDFHVTGVQTCALPIWRAAAARGIAHWAPVHGGGRLVAGGRHRLAGAADRPHAEDEDAAEREGRGACLAGAALGPANAFTAAGRGSAGGAGAAPPRPRGAGG